MYPQRLLLGVSPKNILSSTGFLGRVSLKLTLEPLTLSESNQLLTAIGFHGSVMERFLILSITGGVPRYIELINPKLSAIENIKSLCFEKDGILVDEFVHIFEDLFGRRGDIYADIVGVLSSGPAEYHKIAKEADYPKSGPLSEYLNNLIESGFIQRDYIWLLKSEKDSKLSRFRLSDNYLRFYLKYIRPNLTKIQRGLLSNLSLSSLPGWDSIVGLQFENLVLSNRNLIIKKLKIRPEDIVNDNPYFQTKTTKRSGCQIDYLIQTKYGSLYVCEIKFSRNHIRATIIDDVREKIHRIELPKGFACIPVLIYVGELSSEVKNSQYFAHEINFGEYINYQIDDL